jgi:hypothetical protein
LIFLTFGDGRRRWYVAPPTRTAAILVADSASVGLSRVAIAKHRDIGLEALHRRYEFGWVRRYGLVVEGAPRDPGFRTEQNRAWL